ncbi:hypothetical protein [Paenibacillus ginsengihumi]|jgi:hypothetical protein|uniref:hypothetical protein n=1 Tax=Paenibacillus ginsengihumi TaxID=431596 RepID=UPI000683F4B9|nr:hypothetical protein [Paenibacillus ginsengihumi]
MRPVMDRDAALGDFLEKHVLERWQEDLLAINDAYMEKQAQIEASFTGAVDRVCRKAAELQAQGRKGEIQYIYLSLLRTSVREHRAEYRIDLYDSRWFLDSEECAGSWQADFIFTPLFQRFAGLPTVKREYARKVTDMDIERILQLEAVRYHFLAIEFMRSLVPSLLEGEGYRQMGKHPEICILAGEYRDQSEILYGGPEGVQEKDEAEVRF